MRVDLHMHTTFSDGIRPPEEVVELAIAGGLDVISITDHDNSLGVASARRAAEGRIRVIPGIEMSSRWNGESIHILGYFVDPAAAALTAHYRSLLERRHIRMSRIVGRLADQGIRLTLDQVDGQRASDRVPYTRPHVARALVRDGYATSVTDAFDRYIGSDCPAYVLVESPTPEEVIGSIRAAGGVAVWAHPPLRHMAELLPRLVTAGLRGVEVFRPWARRVREAVASHARRAGLFATGGSDWHGRAGDGELGDFFVRGEDVREFLEAGGR
ncbi:MAG: PHP domain-containing protein [Gemmatimonadetes bacterium]|nr:PHP domain-containing protein [Gemmatimonadota bacterium]